MAFYVKAAWAGTPGETATAYDLGAALIGGADADGGVEYAADSRVRLHSGRWAQFTAAQFGLTEFPDAMWACFWSETERSGDGGCLAQLRSSAGAEATLLATPDHRFALQRASAGATAVGTRRLDPGEYGIVLGADTDCGFLFLSVHDATTGARIETIALEDFRTAPLTEIRIGGAGSGRASTLVRRVTITDEPIAISGGPGTGTPSRAVPPPIRRGALSRRRVLGSAATAVGVWAASGAAHATAATRPPPSARAGDLELKRATTGIPTSSSITVQTYTTPESTDGVRLRCRDLITKVEGPPSESVEPDNDGYANHVVADLSAGHDYEITVEGLVSGEWTRIYDKWWSSHTAPSSGEPSNFLWGAYGCVHSGDADDLPFDLADERGWRLAVFGGDQNYKNKVGTAVKPHLKAWENAWDSATEMTNLMRDVPTFVLVSDHDSGEGGNNGTQSPAIPYQMTAFFKMLPQVQVVDGTRAGAWTWGRFRFVAADFRTLYRSKPKGLPNDDPDKTSYGLDQEAWIIGEISAAHAAGLFVFFLSDAVWLGVEMEGKVDCHASYRATRDRIAASMTQGPGMIVDFDFHCLRLNYGADNNPWGGWPVAGCAAMNVNSGNRRGDGIYDEVWDPRPPGLPLRAFMDFECADDGEQFTVIVRGWEAQNPAAQQQVIEKEFTWPAPSPTA